MTDTEETETVKSILYSWNTDDKTMLWTVSYGGRSVEIKYNQYGLLDYVDGVLDGDDANADLVRYGYDDDYRLTELGYYIYDTNDYVLWTTTYDYDTFGRLSTIEDRLGLTSTYAYNDNHTMESLTLPNGTVTNYTFDDLRRLVSIATTGLSASDVIVKFTYQYNDLGLRDRVTAQDGRTTEWDYDDVGRLVEEHFKSGGPSPTTLLRYVYTYDAAGNRTSKKTDYDDDDGSFAATATYTNNGYNQLTAVTGSPGRGTKVNVTGTIPTAWTLTDGDVTVAPNEGDPVPAEVRGRFFVARNVPLQDGDNTLVASTTATTLAGNEPASDTVEDVTLDTSLDEEYVYNANGDLIQKTEDFNGTTVQWDYTYSVDGWLIEVEKKVGGQTVLVEEYFYDPAGRKYKVNTTQDQQTTTRYFVYDGGSILLELAHVATPTEHYEMETEYVRGLSLGGGIGGLLYTREDDDTVGYFHYDGQGNVVAVTDASRTEVAYYEYDAWGNLLTSCGVLSNEFKFSTKQASTGTGLMDFGWRHYDPKVGRWTRRDPIGAAGGMNLYGFVGQNPIKSIDPWGLDWLDSAASWGAGLGDFLTWGGTKKAREALDLDYSVEYDSYSYGAGRGTGKTGVGVMQVAAAAYIAPFAPGASLLICGFGISNIMDGASEISGAGPNNPGRQGAQALGAAFGIGKQTMNRAYTVAEISTMLYGGYCSIRGSAPASQPSTHRYGCTPEGRPFTRHYATETGPTRNIPGSVVDHTINTTEGVPVQGGKVVHYDPINNVTVVTGDGGSIVSVHKGGP